MHTGKLLIFRCGTEEYGIAIEDLQGISNFSSYNGSAGTMSPLLSDILDTDDGGAKKLLLINTGDVQVTILVDDILSVVELDQKTLEDKEVHSLRFWNFSHKHAVQNQRP